MGRCKNGQAISARRRSPSARRNLRRLIRAARKRNDLDVWRRARGVLGYIDGRRVVELAAELDVTRGSVNRWLGWYETLGIEGLLTGKSPGPPPKLKEAQRAKLAALIEDGPRVAGYSSGVWTGPMIGDLISEQFGVRYHNHHVPRLLHELGFSVQRPRRRLARADAEAQAIWLREKFPAIKKKPRPAEASSCSRTRPASGSTAHSTRPGRELAYNLVSIPSE
jgi:transposase